MINKAHSEFKQEPLIEVYPYSKTFQTSNSSDLLSIFSWNIIHKDFVDPKDFTYASPNDLDWSHRLPKIKSKISSVDSDIVCLQEIDKRSFAQDIGEYFSVNYCFKVNDKKSRVDFSQAILFKRHKFECVYSDYRSRAMILLLTNKLQKSKCDKCKNSKNICFCHSFFIVTVHLDSPRKNKNNESTRVNQIKSVIKRINLCIKERLKLNEISSEITQKIRIILGGDFNTGFDSETSQFLLSKNASNKYSFLESYNQALVLGKRECHKLQRVNECNLRIKYFPTYAAIQNIYAIDLMFYTAQNNNGLRLKGITHTLPEQIKNNIDWDVTVGNRINEWIQSNKKTNLNGQMFLADYSDILLLPNHEFPSDHLPIAAMFEFSDLCGMKSDECLLCKTEMDSVKKTKKNRGKRRNNERLKQRNNEWKFHSINSF